LIFRVLKGDFEAVLFCRVDGCPIYIDDKNGILDVYGVFKGMKRAITLRLDEHDKRAFTDSIRKILLSTRRSLQHFDDDLTDGTINYAVLWQRMKISEDDLSTFNRFSDCILEYISIVKRIQLEIEIWNHILRRESARDVSNTN